MNNVSWQKGLTLNVGADMTFTANGTWHGPTGGTRELHVIRIFDGGTFNVNGDWDPNYTHLQVDNGGEFRFNPKSFKSDNNQWKQSWFDVYGTLDAPAGLKATGNLRMDIITHEGSTIQLGGDVSKNGNAGATLRWLVKGGQIKADGDVHLDCAELEIAAGAAVSVVVAENKVFDLYPFTTIGEGAQITKTGRAFMWTSGTWTIAKDATVVTSGYLFEFGPDAPAATYGERRIVVDGGELRSTASGCKHVIGVDEDFSKPAVIDLRNGALLKTTVAGEFHIGARFSGTGSSKKARGVVIANDSTIELSDQLRILNENNDSNSSGILAMTNSTLKLTNTSKIHELNASGKQWTDAQMILNHTEASFGQLLANARVGSGMSAGKMVGVLTLDGATLQPVEATKQFVYNDQAATKTIELLAGGATVDAAYDITIPAIAYGVGGLVKTGAKTLTLSAANIYEGATVVNEGALRLTGSVAGPLVIGENGTLAVSVADGASVVGEAASLSFDEGAKVTFDVTGLDAKGRHPFLLLPKGAEVSGVPTVEVTGAGKQKWRVVAKNTQDGVLCSVAPQSGFVIMIF